jgi:uncharacterized protein
MSMKGKSDTNSTSLFLSSTAVSLLLILIALTKVSYLAMLLLVISGVINMWFNATTNVAIQLATKDKDKWQLMLKEKLKQLKKWRYYEMNTKALSKRSPLKFHILLLALSLPFWILGYLAEHLADRLPINLPISALMAVCPIITALILVKREDGAYGIKQLMQRSFDYESIKNKTWYLASIFIMPLVLLLSYIIMKLLNRPLPVPHFSIIAIPLFILVFFISAVFEEVGWSAYLYEPMLGKWSVLKAGIFMGTVWGLWHTIPYIQAHNDPVWIVWQIITSILNRVIMIWIYNNSGKNIFTGIIYHMMINVSVFLFPNYGSHYDPEITSIVLGAVTIAIILFSGKKTESEH